MTENQPETLIPEEPTPTQEPTPEAPISPSTSEQVDVPPVAPEVPTEAESAIPVNNQNEQIEPVEAIPTQTAQVDNPSVNEPISEAPEIPTAHSERNEPLLKSSISSVVGNTAKQERVKKKLEDIIEFLNTKERVTNDEVEKLLHISDATATRYLEQLEKEGRIKQEGRAGQGVSYSRI